MTDRFERFTFNIFEISKHWHKIAADEMEKYGLKGSHAIYLTALHNYSDGITAAKLCELCGKDKADTSRMLSIMEKKGLVIKQGANNYRALIKLTEQGKKAAENVKSTANLAVEIAGKGITESQREIFYNTLELIASNLQIISKEGLEKVKE